VDSQLIVSLTAIAALLGLLAMGFWIFAAILIVSILGLHVINDFSWIRIGSALQQVLWRTASSYEVASLPLFIWMAEILHRTRLAEQIFRGLAPWLGWVPGRLLHVTVLGCGLFGSVAGSSAATCATISKIALPELRRRGYHEGVTIGALAAGGTLGILIPPSIIMVLYAIAAEVSLLQLFLAGFLPGFLLMALFSGYIVVHSLIFGDPAPGPDETATLRARLLALLDLLPTLGLLAFVFVALLAGWVTPTECAAWGVFGSLLIALWSGSFTWKAFWDSVHATTRTSCMIMVLIIAAAFMSSFMAISGIPKALAQVIAWLELSKAALIAMLVVIYMVLGIFLEGASMILLTLPVVLPIVTASGIDPIWFGIFLVVVIEMAELSPPVGFNLFILQTMTGRDVFYIGWVSLPFFLLMIVAIALMAIFPDIVMILPRLAVGG